MNIKCHQHNTTHHHHHRRYRFFLYTYRKTQWNKATETQTDTLFILLCTLYRVHCKMQSTKKSLNFASKTKLLCACACLCNNNNIFMHDEFPKGSRSLNLSLLLLLWMTTTEKTERGTTESCYMTIIIKVPFVLIFHSTRRDFLEFSALKKVWLYIFLWVFYSFSLLKLVKGPLKIKTT